MNKNKNTRTIIVAAGAVLREGIASILQNTQYKVLTSAAGPTELTHARFAERHSTLAIVGTNGRDGKLDGTAESVRLLRSLMPDGKVVLVVETHGTFDLPCALAMSPDGCIVNLGSGDTLVKVLELVLMDQQVFAIGHTDIEPEARITGDSSTKKIINGSVVALSPRERQILISIAEGKSNKVIARQFNLTESTVKVHLKAVLRKLGKHNRTQAAIWAIENGLHDSLSPKASRRGGSP